MANFHHRALLIATFAFMPCAPLLAQGGATVSGVHANEAFCKTMVKQVELGAAYMKANTGLLPDQPKQAAYFADQKALNATLVKTAPASLTSDAVNFTKVANAYYDVQLAGRGADREFMKTARRDMSSPEHIAQSKRMNDYCGAKVSTSR